MGYPKGGWYDWDSVEWSLPSSVIARSLGCSISAVKLKRKLLGKVMPIGRPRRCDWKSIDWSKTDVQISVETGFPLSTISHNRRLFGSPRVRSPKKIRPRKSRPDIKKNQLDIEWDILQGIFYAEDGLPTYSEKTMDFMTKLLDNQMPLDYDTGFIDDVYKAAVKLFGMRMKEYSESSDPRVVALRERLRSIANVSDNEDVHEEAN